VGKSRRVAANRAAGFALLRPAAAKIEQLRAGARAKSSRFNTVAVVRDVEALFEQVHLRYWAGLAADHLMVENRAPALHAGSSTEFCS